MAIQPKTQLYANLMDEVKVRIGCINTAIKNPALFPTPIIREFCYLQLRLLCELIALSCLVAHGDIKNLPMREYSADDILKQLSKLRAHFYPFACKQTVDPSNAGGPKQFQLQEIHPAPLSRDDLIKLYSSTHKHLHRGNLKRLLSSQTPLELTINLPEIVGWAQKINDLLSIHTIAIDENNLIICTLRNSGNNNRVQVATAIKSLLTPSHP